VWCGVSRGLEGGAAQMQCGALLCLCVAGGVCRLQVAFVTMCTGLGARCLFLVCHKGALPQQLRHLLRGLFQCLCDLWMCHSNTTELHILHAVLQGSSSGTAAAPAIVNRQHSTAPQHVL
jgi:hypothetical protein